jgi:hypothetical protein
MNFLVKRSDCIPMLLVAGNKQNVRSVHNFSSLIYSFISLLIWYALPVPLQTSGGCWIVRAGRNLAKPHYEVGPKVIRQFGLHLVLNGVVKVSEGKMESILEKGDAFCLFPGRTYSYRTLSGNNPPLQMAWLAVDGPQSSLLLAEAGFSDETPKTFRG